MKAIVIALVAGLGLGWGLFFGGTLLQQSHAGEARRGAAYIPLVPFAQGCGDKTYRFDWVTGRERVEWTRRPDCTPVIPDGPPRLPRTAMESWVAHETGASSVPVPIGFIVGAGAVLTFFELRYRRSGKEWL